MKSYNLIFVVFAAFAVSAATNSTQRVKPQITRTSLHVARSLDPENLELLQVKAKNGEMATLIVKKREGSNSSSTSDQSPSSTAVRTQNPSSASRELKFERVPNPVEIRSDVMYVKDDSSAKKKGRNLSRMTIEDGVPVIEGVREPDAPEDKFHTWRNAKVINGVLVPHKQSLNAEIPLKQKHGDKTAAEKQEVTLSSHFEANEQIPSMFGEDDAVKSQWKGIAETIPVYNPNPERVYMPIPLVFPKPDNSHAKIIEFINKINEKEIQKRRKTGRSIDLFEGQKAERRMDENVDENEEPIWVNNHPQEIWTEEGKISIAERRMDSTDERDSVYDKDDKFIPIAPVQGRLMQPQGISNYPTSAIYSNQPSRVSFEEGVRTPVLQYAHPELGAQPVKVERGVEDVDITKSKDTMPSLTYFSNDPFADRSPYAYEPGLASTSTNDILASSSDINVGVSQDRESGRRQAIRNIEFTTSAPQSSSFNPDEIDITESPERLKSGVYSGSSYRDIYEPGNDNYLQSYQHFGYPGKYSMTKEDYYKWKMSGMSYGNSQNNGNYYIKIPDNRPLWEKITESIKETVQSGVESMKEITRPVMEPLVEATQRISENLGIPKATATISNTLGLNHGTGMRNALQEKIGAAASSSPVLLPALGLVGAGAALGLGAVAVGRLLDVNVNLLKRSDSGEEPADAKIEMEHKRALEAIQNGEITAQNKTDNPSSEGRDMKQSGRSLPLKKDEENEKESNKNELKRLIDDSGIEGLEKFHFDPNENIEENKSRRRSLIIRTEEQDQNEEYLAKLQRTGAVDLEEVSLKLGNLGEPNAWRNLPCAQKIFCEALAKGPSENIPNIENRIMPTKLSVQDTTSKFVQQVLDASKSQDCTSFVCHRKVRR